MVNVPGRSKGCNTCRKRRVKCDEGKPTCQRCNSAGFECLGYERERIWRNTSTIPFPESSSSLPQPGNEAALRMLPRGDMNRVDSPSPPSELSLVAFKGDFCFAFMFANHVWRSSGVLWLEQAASGRFGGLSLNATSALSQANFGRSNHQPDIESQGVALYGQCLTALAGQLATLTRGGQDLIVPILVLLTHAASQSDRLGAVFHLRGIARLLHLCGPEAFQQQPLLNAFEAARAILLVSSLIGKQRLFLEGEPWRTIPWIRDPASKTPQSELLDILIIVPGILQEHAALESSNSTAHVLFRELLELVKEQLVLLFRWRWKWQARSGHEVGTGTGFASPPLAITGPITRLRFRRFVVASELMLYNVTLMWLVALLFKMDPLGTPKEIAACASHALPFTNTETRFISFQPLRRPGAATTLRDPALEICRTFEWITRHHEYSKGSPTFLYLFPVGVAMTALQDEPDSMAWIKSMLDASPATAEYALGANQAGFGFYLSREALAEPGMPRVEESLFSDQDMRRLGALKIS